jgi:DNA-binding response OmpR family regulator
MISARAEISDRIQGLESGADDYLSKPFDFGELLARVRSLLRREMLHKSRRIEIGDLRIDTALRSVVRGERQVLLTRLEYDLLECLASQEGRTVTRDLLLERIWTDNSPISNKIDVAIASLRKKIDRGQPSRLIHTVHGFGYKLAVGSREP